MPHWRVTAARHIIARRADSGIYLQGLWPASQRKFNDTDQMFCTFACARILACSIAVRKDRARTDGRKNAPQRDARKACARIFRIRLRKARGDDSYARRREIAYRHSRSARRQRSTDSSDAHSLQRIGAGQSRQQFTSRQQPLWLRQRYRRDCRRWIHPCDPGYPRQIWLRRRLRHDPPLARTDESNASRSLHRHVRHYRLAGQKYSRGEWQSWNPGNFLRRIFAADGAGKSSPSIESRSADESHGRRLEGRRLVSQWRIPSAEYAVYLRTRSH